MRIVISGASGFVGRALVRSLGDDPATEVVTLVRPSSRGAGDARHAADPRTAPWDPDRGTLDPAVVAGASAVVHLAGENVAAGRWTPARKARILESRTRGTRLVAETMAGVPEPRPALVTASAIGVYGDRGDEILDEGSAAGDGFLADVVRAWEASADPARDAGARVAHLRFGVVLGRGGGALPRMETLFRFGLGGKLGSGRQWMSWVSLRDTVAAIRFAIDRPELSGPVNVTAPEPVRNDEFTRELARVLRRPAFLPAPAFALRLVLGEMAREMLLGGQRVRPARLEEAGFRFEHARLPDALADLFAAG
jgi:uncharacterized protein (TIGR01777 family)